MLADRRSLSVLLLSLLLLSSLSAASSWVTLSSNEPAEPRIEVLSSNLEQTILDVELPGYYVSQTRINGVDHALISAPGLTPILEAGAPALPKLYRSIVIPDQARMEARVEVQDWVDLPLGPLAPSKGNLLRTVDPSQVAAEFGPVYSQDKLFPTELVTLGEPYILRDYRGQVVQMHPFQYNPVTQTLRVFSRFQVTIETSGPAQVRPKANRRPSRDRAFKTIYENHFLNDDAAGILYDAPYEMGPMLIICADEYLDAMTPFVDWKRTRGVPVELVPLSDIGNSASNIQNAVTNRYNSPAGLTFLLLVGDGPDIATKSYSGSAADPTYGCVDGGNGDWYPDLFVGRFSAGSVADVETQVAKVIHYERDATFADTWYTRATGVASNQGTGQGDDGEADNVHMDNIRSDLLGYGYTEVDQIYDPSANSTMVANAINDGRGFVNYTGHGSTSSWSSSGFSNSNVNSLSNDGMLPVINSVACVNGNFTNSTCFAETWLRAGSADAPTGAVVFYGSSINQSWAPPMCAQDETTDLLVAEDNTVAGALLFNGSCQMMDEYGSGGYEMFATWHIFGDPSLQMRSGIPMAYGDLGHEDIMIIGDTQFSISAPDAAGSLVSLTLNGEILSAATIPAGGALTLDFDALAEPDTVLLTVTGHNRIPYQAELLIIAPDGPYLIHGGYQLEDDLTGNGNLRLDYGETAELYLVLNNVGTVECDSGTVTLSTSDPYLTIADSVQVLLPTTADSSSVVGPFMVSASPDVTNGYQSPVQAHITSGALSWDYEIMVTHNAPIVTLNEVVVADGDNHRLDIGELCDLEVQIGNVGQADILQGVLTLTTDDPFVTIMVEEEALGDVTPDQPASAFFSIEVQYAMPACHEIHFDWNLSGELDYAASGTFSLMAGQQIEDFETADFEAFQWIQGGHLPWTIDASESFEGGFAARSGAIGNNQNSEMTLHVHVTEASQLHFMSRTSSGSGDQLHFYVDGIEEATYEGVNDWTESTFWIMPGQREFTWKYSKNYSGTSGADAAWVDFIVLPTSVVPGTVIGDVNADIQVNIQDVIRLVNIILGEGTPPEDSELYCGDLNGDSQVDIGDLVLLVNMIMGNPLDRDIPTVDLRLERVGAELWIYGNQALAGLEMKYAGDFEMAPLDLSQRWISNGDLRYGLIYSMDAATLDMPLRLGSAGKNFNLKLLKVATGGGEVIELDDRSSTMPEDFAIYPNYPNPFNPSTTFRYALPERSKVQIGIFDLQGRQVIQLVDAKQPAGEHHTVWDGRNVRGQRMAAGLYLARIQAGPEQHMLKVMLLK